ncbi:MAG: 4Fe-4S dicluster domain-containing protein [Anaerolineae bacterium]|nr:4Fe-4S dicluster domain-containing protein [Anaerolineae bacterium]
MRIVIPVEDNDTLAAVRGFLKQLLEAEVVDALLVPMETPAGTITPALVADPDLLDAVNPLAPVMGLNTAHVAGQVSIREPRGRSGVVLRPCELRALVELVKLKQASLNDMVTIGVDCLGTYDVPVYTALARSETGQSLDMAALLATAQSGELAPQKGYAFRDGCQMCEKPHVEEADIVLELYGADLAAGIPVSLSDEVAGKLGMDSVEVERNQVIKKEPGFKRAEVVEKVVAARTRVRDARFAEMRQRLEREGVEGVLAACVRCHNCMTVCPLCYCKTCLFKSPVFDHEPMQYMNWARRKGAYRLPADTTLFHLTRLNHMVLSCVGCGMCTSDCPAELPVGLVFRAIGREVQETFDYAPGRSVEEPLPMITFREDEWMEVGEE